MNNPIKFIDADGNVIVDEKGRPITISVNKNEGGSYSATFKLEDGTDVSKEFMNNGGRLISTLITTPTGREIVDKAISVPHHINIKTTNQTIARDKDGKLVLGVTRLAGQSVAGYTFESEESNNPITVDYLEITIFERSISAASGYGTDFGEETKGFTRNQKAARVLAHEFEHSTNPVHVDALKSPVGITQEQHEDASKVEKTISSEFNEQNTNKPK